MICEEHIEVKNDDCYACRKEWSEQTGQPMQWREDDPHGEDCAMRVTSSAECTCGKLDYLAAQEESFDRYGLTLREKEQLEHIAGFGYGVYKIPRQSLPTFRHVGNWAIADPEDGADGLYLVINTIEQGWTALMEGGWIGGYAPVNP